MWKFRLLRFGIDFANKPHRNTDNFRNTNGNAKLTAAATTVIIEETIAVTTVVICYVAFDFLTNLVFDFASSYILC